MGTHVYIDGFNLYYGCLKDSPYRWLDLEALCAKLLPQDAVLTIRYFTARVTARPADPQAPVRQQTYLRALATLPTVTLHFGQFKEGRKRLPLADPPSKGARTAEVIRTEEKGSDVNLASHLLMDGFLGQYDTAVVISNDSDLVTPVRLVRHQLNLKIGVINPHPPAKRSRELMADANFVKQIRKAALRTSQFPPQLRDGQGAFSKPKGW